MIDQNLNIKFQVIRYTDEKCYYVKKIESYISLQM